MDKQKAMFNIPRKATRAKSTTVRFFTRWFLRFFTAAPYKKMA